MSIEDLRKGKSAELYVLAELIKRGADVYVPTVDRGIDAIVRRKDGSYLEIQVKATQEEDQSGYFNVRDIDALSRDKYFVVCVDMNETKAKVKGRPNIWILKADEFKEYAQGATKGGEIWGYRLPIYERSRKHGNKRRDELLKKNFEAWELLMG